MKPYGSRRLQGRVKGHKKGCQGCDILKLRGRKAFARRQAKKIINEALNEPR